MWFVERNEDCEDARRKFEDLMAGRRCHVAYCLSKRCPAIESREVTRDSRETLIQSIEMTSHDCSIFFAD